MGVKEFNFHEWEAPIITTVSELSKQLSIKPFIGEVITEIWNIGIIYQEEEIKEIGEICIELDEPIIFIINDTKFEILAVDGSTFRVSYDTLNLNEQSYQKAECDQSAQKYLKRILNQSILEINVKATAECEFTGAFGLKLSEQKEYIDEIIIKFDSEDTLHITTWYDYMHAYVKDKNGDIAKFY